MKFNAIGASFGALLIGFASAAEAQVLGFVTTQAGSLSNSIASAVAKVTTEKAGVRVTVQATQSNGQDAVAAGTGDLGISNSFDIKFFMAGTEDYAGKGKHENIRVITRMVPLFGGVMVKKDSPIKTVKDLKGKRIGSQFGAQKTIHRIWEAYLANADLTYNDVQQVLARNVIGGADDFASGKTDSFMFALGAAKVKEVNSSVGGIRALPIDPSPPAVARMQKFMPGSYAYQVKPSPRMEEVAEPTYVIAYDFMLFTNTKTPADTIYKITKALHDNKDALVSTFAGLNDFNPKEMAIEHDGLIYHAGAEKYYKEAGMWPPKKPGV